MKHQEIFNKLQSSGKGLIADIDKAKEDISKAFKRNTAWKKLKAYEVTGKLSVANLSKRGKAILEEAEKYVAEEPKFSHFEEYYQSIIQNRIDRYVEAIEGVKRNYEKQKYLWEVAQERKVYLAELRKEKAQGGKKTEEVKEVEEKVQEVEKEQEKKVTIADLLLQIEDAQSKIQEAQKQIAESLEAIKALQAQEPERQEAQQVEKPKEPKKPSQGEYYQKFLDIGGANLEGRSDELLKAARKLDNLEDKAAALGCPMEYDGHHRANHLRGLADEFGKLDSYLMDLIGEENFEEVEKQFEFIESGRFLNGGLGFDENMERANKQIAEYELAIETQERYLKSIR